MWLISPIFLTKVLDILTSEETYSKLFREIRRRTGIHYPRCDLRRLKGHGNYGQRLKRYLCKVLWKDLKNDKIGTIFQHSRLKLEGMIHVYFSLLSPAQLC
ncbi:MAG: hypothetical protein KIH10_12720 [Candidatus Freyarchaeota archaeon]|nr:hypothetical protein [Candidatus Jordarchaeia archaeon]MBS7279575.1 hypothetical protein [Candidatus Jordarchaeia archaeon]